MLIETIFNCDNGRHFDKYMFDLFNLIDVVHSPMSTSAKSEPDALTRRGLKAIINRPHNLYTEEKDGIISKYCIETVYTPWSADDVKISYSNTPEQGAKLNVSVGKDTSKYAEAFTMVERYRGISKRAFTFDLPLMGLNVDPKNISVTAEDGLLRIELPVDRTNDEVLSIKVKK